MHCQLKTRLLMGAVLIVQAAPIYAQRQIERDDTGDTALEEIIVTARFRRESIQDIGASVAAVSGEDLTRHGVRDFEDLSRLLAGVQTIKSRQNSNDIAIRGVIDAKGGSRTTSSLYSVFLDDVSVAAPGRQRDYSSFDLDRIELIRGPQPTLFGEGAVGGVIRYFTNDPDLGGPNFSFVANGVVEQIQGGALAHSLQTAASLIVIPEKMGMRLSGFVREDGGFIDNPGEGEDVNDFDGAGGRAVILMRPTNALEVRLSAFLARDEMGESTQIDPGSNPEDLTFAVSPRSGTVKDDFDLYAARINYDFGPIAVTSITGYYERYVLNSRFSASNTFGLVPFFDTVDPNTTLDTTTFQLSEETQVQWSQEFRFISDFEGPINFTAGLYYRDKDILDGTFVTCDACVAVTSPPTAALSSTVDTDEATQYSGFLEFTYEVSDAVRLIAGARYIDEKLVSTIVANEVAALSPRFDAAGNIIPWTEDDPIGFVFPADVLNTAGFGTSFEFDLERALPRGGVEYDLNDDILFYASAGAGSRNGGVGQALAALTVSGGDPQLFVDNLLFDEDSVLTIEGGMKSSWLDGDLSVNIGAFHTRYKDTQLLVFVPANNVTNGPDQRIRGLEVETAYQVNDYLSTFFNATTLDAEFTGGTATVDLEQQGIPLEFDIAEGNTPRNAPALSFAAGYSLSYPLGRGDLSLISSGSFQYIDERFTSNQNYPTSRLDSLTNLNLRLGVENERLSLIIFVTNLLNDIEEVEIQTSSLGHSINSRGVLDSPSIGVHINRPRAYGLRFTVRY